MIELAASNSVKSIEDGACLTCYWWSRNKQSKKGECVKSAGRLVTDTGLDRSRVAYPRTLSSECCPEYTEKS